MSSPDGNIREKIVRDRYGGSARQEVLVSALRPEVWLAEDADGIRIENPLTPLAEAPIERL
jgi:hypothetical protein